MSARPRVFEKPILSGPLGQDEFDELEDLCIGYYNKCTGICTPLFLECDWEYTIGGIAATGISTATIIA